jgi:RND family efflux transporter MFP subunit
MCLIPETRTGTGDSCNEAARNPQEINDLRRCNFWHGSRNGMPARPPEVSMPDIVLEPPVRSGRRLPARAAAAVGGTVAIALLVWALRPTSDVPRARLSDLWISTVQEGPLAIVVSAGGTFTPVQQRWITAAEPGTVESVRVQAGDLVSPDTVLAVLVNPALESLRSQAEAAVASAKASRASLHAQLTGQLLTLEAGLASAQLQATTTALKEKAERPLFETHVISALEYTTLQLQAREQARLAQLAAEQLGVFKESMAAQDRAAAAQVASLQAVLEGTRERIGALSVRASLEGVVQDVAVHAGQTLILGSNLARVASQKELKVSLQVPASEASEVAIGQRVTLELASDGPHRLNGRIVRLSPAVDNGTVAADVAPADPLPAEVRPNLVVTGEIHVADIAHTLYVQRPAYSGPRRGMTLYRLTEDGHSALATHVLFGVASDHYIQITSGLKAGDRVIASDTGGFGSAARVRLQ